MNTEQFLKSATREVPYITNTPRTGEPPWARDRDLDVAATTPPVQPTLSNAISNADKHGLALRELRERTWNLVCVLSSGSALPALKSNPAATPVSGLVGQLDAIQQIQNDELRQLEDAIYTIARVLG